MAKGQKKSGREAKKPKKSAAEKAKPGGGTAYSQAFGGKGNASTKKS
jgi:hypothetical protein